jgi:predicted acyltransferase
MAAAVAVRPSAAAPPSTRMRALDGLRGLAVLGMILVNNQGSGAHAFWGMAHADWNGWSPADLVFPTFLFVVGGSMALSMQRRPMSPAKAARRAVLLFAIGLALNALPPTVLAEIRTMGVLQRIGLCFFLAYLVVRYVPVRRQWLVGAAALIGYWLVVAQWPMTPAHSLPGIVDRFLLGARHVYKNGGNDPEGLASTVTATMSVLAGYWTVRWLRAGPLSGPRLRRLALAGLGIAVAGQLWGLAFPINKRLWTSSYVVLTSGIAMLALAGLTWLTEQGWPARRMEIFGMNALVIFAGSEIVAAQMKDLGARVFVFDHLYAPLFGFRLGALVYGLVLVALWWLVAWVMWQRKVFVKV